MLVIDIGNYRGVLGKMTHCQCGCEQEILLKRYHKYAKSKYNYTPKYIQGHNRRGKKHSLETLNKMCITQSKHIKSIKHCQAISIGLKGRTLTNEHCKNMVIANSKPSVKLQRSLSATKRLQRGDVAYKHSRIGKVNNITLRSSWEIAFALYLNDQQLEWEYEKTHYLLSNNTYYTPDFFVRQQVFEIKGYWAPIAKQKFELFKKEYPDINIKVLEYEQLKTILEKYATQIEQIVEVYKNGK